ncbi:hypothetical protein Pelo_16975 [Pelomyxa schiedti]|nr:hypothetical protein Pelo_16975 [Pelomyxa schiedti]
MEHTNALWLFRCLACEQKLDLIALAVNILTLTKEPEAIGLAHPLAVKHTHLRQLRNAVNNLPHMQLPSVEQCHNPLHVAAAQEPCRVHTVGEIIQQSQRVLLGHRVEHVEVGAPDHVGPPLEEIMGSQPPAEQPRQRLDDHGLPNQPKCV